MFTADAEEKKVNINVIGYYKNGRKYTFNGQEIESAHYEFEKNGIYFTLTNDKSTYFIPQEELYDIKFAKRNVNLNERDVYAYRT